MTDPFVLLDNSLSTKEDSFLFKDPIVEIKATRRQEIDPCLKKIDEISSQGLHIAGFISYEVGSHILEIKSKDPSTPYLWFYGFRKKDSLSANDVRSFFKENVSSTNPSSVFNFNLSEPFSTYQHKLSQLKEFFKNGDSYQVNYTLNSNFEYTGDLASLYLKLRERQPVEYGAFLNFPGLTTLSFSPELFFKRNKNHIFSKPMKGTAARSSNQSTDEKIKQQMKMDEKIISENLMIVDMVRNDLTRIAQPGTIETKSLFEIETYKTVHQMTSTVSAQAQENIQFSDIIKNIFPCASITGAPKKRTMEIINKLESQPRGIYTGAIGYLSSNEQMCFNVPIRTITVATQGHGSMGLGGGILFESSIEDEYQECLDKSLFLKNLNDDFYIIESIYFNGKDFAQLDLHLERLQKTASLFLFPTPLQRINQLLLEFTKTKKTPHKLRLALYQNQHIEIQTSPVEINLSEKHITLSSIKTHSKDIFLQHKTSHREIYKTEYSKYNKQGFYDVIFENEQGQITEACRHNLFIEKNSFLYTPPLSCGLLPGIKRHTLIQNGAIEKEIFINDLKTADKIFLSNSIRGLVEVKLK